MPRRGTRQREKLSEEKARNLATLINTIETTDDPDVAIKAYARGVAIDRTSVALHEAQMKKMLTLGQPLTARYPAKAINSLAPENALAWGVTAYYESRKGNYDSALRAILTSLEFDTTNPSVLSNAGKLAVWYEFQKAKPELSDRQKRTLDKLKDNIKELKDFSDGYEKMSVKFQEHAKVMEEFDKLTADAEAVVEKYTNDLKTLGDSAKQIDDEIATHEKDLKLLRSDYLDCLDDDDDKDDDDNDDRANRAAKKRIKEEIAAKEDVIKQLKSKRNELIREARTVKTNLTKSKKELKKVRTQSQAAVKQLQDNFQWDPPAVNGVVTLEKINTVRSNAKAPELSTDAEAEAKSKLKLAVTYIQNNMQEKAAKILREIIADYKDTEAAKEAEKLLNGLPEKLREKSDS